MAEIEGFLAEKNWGRLQWAKAVPVLPLAGFGPVWNVLKLAEIQSCFSAVPLYVTEVPWSSSNPDFAVCYHDVIKLNATSDRNRYSLPVGSFSKLFLEAEGEGLPQLNFPEFLLAEKTQV